MPATPLSFVTAFIADITHDDFAQIRAAVKDRRHALSAALRPDTPVRLEGLRPQYLGALTGQFQSTAGTRGTVLLDESSAARLRPYGARRFRIPSSTTRHTLTGVPLTCCATQP
jgi:hypothetical protein